MSKYWLDYVKSCYDLIVESEGLTEVYLNHEVEAYLVHLLANNFERTNIGEKAVAIMLLEALQQKRKEQLLAVADECLLIHSYPFKKQRWPTPTYYQEMGKTAYAYANHVMEHNFVVSSKVLNRIFVRVI